MTLANAWQIAKSGSFSKGNYGKMWTIGSRDDEDHLRSHSFPLKNPDLILKAEDGTSLLGHRQRMLRRQGKKEGSEEETHSCLVSQGVLSVTERIGERRWPSSNGKK